MLVRPSLIATSAAVGFAVSVGLYLPTLFAGAGRMPTLATEAVTLQEARTDGIVGVTALLQGGPPP